MVCLPGSRGTEAETLGLDPAFMEQTGLQLLEPQALEGLSNRYGPAAPELLTPVEAAALMDLEASRI